MAYRIVLLFAFFFHAVPGLFAQQDSLLQAEIDQQVWRPFISSYQNFDAAAFNQLHTDDVLRASPWGLHTGANYLDKNLEHFTKNKASGNTQRIAFTFEYRIHQSEMAYEVGYYRITSIRDDKKQVGFGQFHVVLKKINGVWKIAQDWDAGTINGTQITEADFLRHANKGLYE